MTAPIPRASTRTEVQTFYHFITLSEDDVQRIHTKLHESAKKLEIAALIILGPEGLNATASGESASLDKFVAATGGLLSPGLEFLNIKKSFIEVGEKLPFLGFTVKVRKEIVTLKRPDILPKEMKTATHLSPEEWHRRIQNPDAIIIDTRNDYESAIGTFRNALTPQIEEFSDFPDWVDKNRDKLDSSKETFIFCTGGIRCEKAIFAMEEKGFKNIYQLDGGILNYIQKFPATKTDVPEGSLWDGECFVFDHRVAVDGDGRASQKYSLCPHCGDPAEHPVFCARCDSPAVICDPCFNEQSQANACTCSKNCSYHWGLHPGQKGKPQVFAR